MIQTLLRTALLGVGLLATPALAASPKGTAPMASTPAQVTYSNADGTTETLASAYPGKAVLVVNTASQCGYTPQYAGLESLFQKYKDRGLVVVAFPSNDYGGQEPGTDAEILEFCSTRFNVTFPVKAKMPTKGPGKSPLYAALTGPQSPFPGEVGWNFEKFLLDPSGKVVARFKSSVKPESDQLVAAVENALKQ